ncbi:hypothetical protein RYX36_030713 [Vicia faba]
MAANEKAEAEKILHIKRVEDMDFKVKQMIKLIEEDADSFTRRAEAEEETGELKTEGKTLRLKFRLSLSMSQKRKRRFQP